MATEVNKDIFSENLKETIDEIMRLNVLNPNRIEDKLFSLDEVVSTLAFSALFVPIWINIQYIESSNEK